MKQAILLHGTGGNNHDYFWFADTKIYLESLGYTVLWPQLPNSEKPNIHNSLEFMLKNNTFDESTVLIGHSSACPLILSLLQSIAVTVNQAILVAGFYKSLNDDGFSDLMLEKKYDWNKIKLSAQEIILINSDNDPWGCTDAQARPIANKLDAKLIVATGQGHMGSNAFNQPYLKFELLKQLIK